MPCLLQFQRDQTISMLRAGAIQSQPANIHFSEAVLMGDNAQCLFACNRQSFADQDEQADSIAPGPGVVKSSTDGFLKKFT